jgi:hypothetical protein
LDKSKIALISLSIGLALLIYSWYISYPISLKYPGDVVFNHIPLYYWISLPIVLGSLYIIGAFSKSQPLRSIASIIIILIVYSLSYFYFTLPTSDSQFFTGLSQYFINSKSLDSSQFIHQYYQWPSFFLLANIATSVSGLSLNNYQFFLFAVIGSLLATALYVYAAKLFKSGAILSVVTFLMAMFYFFNYQAVPFSLALALLFALFMLETRKKNTPLIVTMLILFFGITIAHSFVALFFVFYLLFRAIISRSKLYAELCLLAANIFLITQFTLSSYWIGLSIQGLFRVPTEYSSIVSATLNPVLSVPVPIDTISQTVSRLLTISVVLICLIGFISLLTKRKLRATDGAIFLAGVAYSVLGLAISSLGERAIVIFFIPISLGAVYLLQTKLRPYLIGLFLILLILFVAVPIHTSFTSYPITYQTKNDLTTSNFAIQKFNWNSRSIVIGDLGMAIYMLTQVPGNSQIDTGVASTLGLENIAHYDCVIYSVGLGNSIQKSGLSIDNTSQSILQKYSVVYNSGSDYIATKNK